MFKTVALVILTLLVSGCSQKITIKSIKPSEVFDKDIKKVSIDSFKNDDISLADVIQSNMGKISFNNKRYFTIVNRKQNQLLTEEKILQDSGLVDTTNSGIYDFGEVNSVITGSVNSKNYSTNNFYEKRIDYDRCIKYKKNKDGKKECSAYKQYTVLCTDHIYNIDATVTITSVSNNSIIYTNNYLKTSTISKCSDESKIIPSTITNYKKLAYDIAQEFVSKVSPSYRYIKVTLKDEPDIKYTNVEENMLENGLKLIDLKHISKSNELFKKLTGSTKYKSVTAIYNYAITTEALGDLPKAYKLLKKAESLSLEQELDEDIILSLNRLEKSMKNKQKALKQIEQ